jgi:hypothetical protein
MQTQKHWKDSAMAGSQVITDAWDVTKAILGRLAEWVLFVCMVMNIIEILPGVVLAPLVSNLVLSVQAITLDVAGFGLASMADHARDMGDEQAARTGKRTGWFLIGLMIVTLLLVSIGLLWPVVKQYTDPAEKVLILARVIMTVIYSHVVHSLRRSTNAYIPQAVPAAAPLDINELARQVAALLHAPQIDYQELVQRIVPLLPTSQVDAQELVQRLLPLLPAPQMNQQVITEQLEAIIQREVTAIRASLGGAEGGAGASLRPRSQSHLLALEPPARATLQSHSMAPEPLAGATPRSHPLVPEPLVRATRRSHLAAPVSGSGATAGSQPEPLTGAIEARLQAAYQELTAEGGRVSGRALAVRARCNRSTATEWLQSQFRGAEVESEPPAEATAESQPEPVEVSA